MHKKLFFCFILSSNFLIFSSIANEISINAEDESLIKSFVNALSVHRSSSLLRSNDKHSGENLNVSTIEPFTALSTNNLSGNLTSAPNLKKKVWNFDELCEEFTEFKKDIFLNTKDLATDNYTFEEKMFTQPLSNNQDKVLLSIYQYLNRMVRVNAPDLYQMGMYDGHPFISFNLPSSNRYADLFKSDPTALQYFCNVVYREPLIFPRDQEKAKSLVNQGTTFAQIEAVLQKIHTFLPDPGLYIKMRNSFHVRRKSEIGESIYSTLEGAPGSRRGSVTIIPSTSSPQLSSIVNTLSSAEPLSRSPQFSHASNPISAFQPYARRGSKGYSAGDTTAEFLKKFQQRRWSSSVSNSSPSLSQHSSPSSSQPSTPSSSQPSTPSSSQPSNSMNELRSSNKQNIPLLSLEPSTIMEDE